MMDGGVPLRIQLLATTLLLVFLALLVSDGFALSSMQRYLTDRVDGQLSTTAQLWAQDQARGAPPGPPELPSPPNGSGPALLSAFYTEIVDSSGNGTSQLRQPHNDTESAPRLPLLNHDGVARYAGKAFTAKSNGSPSPWRVLVTPAPGGGAFVAATSLSDVLRTVGRLRHILVVIDVFVLVSLSWLGYRLVRSRLRALESMEGTAGKIAAGDLELDRRLVVAGTRTEVGRLALAFNAMLSRIELAFRARAESEEEARQAEVRLRRFVADASHELATPLTSIRGFAEVYRQCLAVGEAPPGEHLMSRVESEAIRMGALVDDLLLLAHLDEQRPMSAEVVDLEQILQDAAADASLVSGSHPVRLDIARDAPGAAFVVVGDHLRLKQVFGNLISNVVRHTPAGTTLDISLARSERTTVIRFQDNGPGMTEVDAQHAFDRFYRSDPSRARTSGGSGLGLSIVQEIVQAHGGSITLNTAPDKGAAFTISLPDSARTGVKRGDQ